VIKAALLLRKLLATIFRLIAGFFRWLLGSIFYKILVKIYYQLFRWRKKGLIKNSPLEILWRQPVYIFIFTLVFVILFSSWTNTDRAGSMETKIPKTIMANFVGSEFDLTQDDLIEEVSTPNSIIAAGKDKYLDDSCALSKQDTTDTNDESDSEASFSFDENNDLVFKPELFESGGSPKGASEAAIARRSIIYYTVQDGDTISTISRHFGITVNTILWANNLTAYSLIRAGDRLAILPYSGVLYTVKKGDTLAKIAQDYDIDLEKIVSCNTLGNSITVGQKIVVPGAKQIEEEVAVRKATTPSYTGISIIKDFIKTPTIKISGNKMAWPTQGHNITQYYSWRHTGVDIANHIGTPIYAADSGTVVIAQGGWNGGYGNTIVIDHGGGKRTRYGHASKLFVKVGDEVEKGENIAAMGSTGNSTGPHLHFEVLINGSRTNPLNYIR
jgi:LysM repeat protein